MGQDLDLLVTGGTVVDPGTGHDGPADVAIADGVIVELAPGIAPTRARRVVDATGHRVLPGVVDSHVHLPGRLASGGSAPGHRRLARAGVTTAVEFAQFSQVVDEWHANAAGLTLLGVEGMPAYTGQVPAGRVADDVAAALRCGAIGVKILGGHFPSTPEATESIIAESTARGAYTAFHAGTTRHGSNLDGMIEALELADGRPLHLAHTNAYLRGAVKDLITENLEALALLQQHPRVVSESHMAPLNLAFGEFDGDMPTDHIARNCLALEGFEVSRQGLERAISEQRAHVHVPDGQGLVTGPEALDHLSAGWPPLSFPVNRRLTAYLQASARLNSVGELCYEGPGTFIVDAISSDGGGWRNLILDQAILLVHFGALSWLQLAEKTSWRPAQLFGLGTKGRLDPGADADVIVVDAATRTVTTTIASGQVIAEGGRVTGTGGVVLTSAEGAATLRERDIPHRVHDLADSAFHTKGVN